MADESEVTERDYAEAILIAKSQAANQLPNWLYHWTMRRLRERTPMHPGMTVWAALLFAKTGDPAKYEEARRAWEAGDAATATRYVEGIYRIQLSRAARAYHEEYHSVL